MADSKPRKPRSEMTPEEVMASIQAYKERILSDRAFPLKVGPSSETDPEAYESRIRAESRRQQYARGVIVDIDSGLRPQPASASRIVKASTAISEASEKRQGRAADAIVRSITRKFETLAKAAVGPRPKPKDDPDNSQRDAWDIAFGRAKYDLWRRVAKTGDVRLSKEQVARINELVRTTDLDIPGALRETLIEAADRPIGLIPIGKSKSGEPIFAAPNVSRILFSQMYARDIPRRDRFNPTVNDPVVRGVLMSTDSAEIASKYGDQARLVVERSWRGKRPDPAIRPGAAADWDQAYDRALHDAFRTAVIKTVGDDRYAEARKNFFSAQDLIRKEPVIVDMAPIEGTATPQREDFPMTDEGRRFYEAAVNDWRKKVNAERAIYVCHSCRDSVDLGHACKCTLNKRLKLKPFRPFRAPKPPLDSSGNFIESKRAEYNALLTEAMARHAAERERFLGNAPVEKRIWMEAARRIRKEKGPAPRYGTPERLRYEADVAELAGRELMAEIQWRLAATRDVIVNTASPISPMARRRVEDRVAARAVLEKYIEQGKKTPYEITLALWANPDDMKIVLRMADERFEREYSGKTSGSRRLGASKAALLDIIKDIIPGTTIVEASSKEEAEMRATALTAKIANAAVRVQSATDRRIEQLQRELEKKGRLSEAKKMELRRLLAAQVLETQTGVRVPGPKGSFFTSDMPTSFPNPKKGLSSLSGFRDDPGGTLTGFAVAGLALFAIFKAVKSRSTVA